MGYGLDRYLKNYFIPGTPATPFSIDAFLHAVFVSAEAVAITGTVTQAQAKQVQAVTALEAMIGSVGQAQDRQTQAVTAAESMIAAVGQAQDRQLQAITAAESMIAAVAQSQPEQAQVSTGIVLIAVTGAVAQAQALQAQTVTTTEAMLATVVQAQPGQAQAVTAAESMLGAVAQEQAGQRQAATGAVVTNIVGQVAQSQVLQGQQIGAAAVVSVVSGGGALPILRRRGKTFYITVPGGKRKKPVRVEVKAAPKPPEEDRRHVLEALRKLASLRLEPTPVLPKIDRAMIRQAVLKSFTVVGRVDQSQTAQTQQDQGKTVHPDYEKALEEMLLLWTA